MIGKVRRTKPTSEIGSMTRRTRRIRICSIPGKRRSARARKNARHGATPYMETLLLRRAISRSAILLAIGSMSAHPFAMRPKSEVNAAALRSMWDGVYTDAQAARGQAQYRQECASCHGDRLEGGGEIAPAPELAGDIFM